MQHKITVYIFLIFSTLIYSQEIRELGSLPAAVTETSGLIFHNGKLITHNDSGNSPQLFEIDTTSLEITRTVTISNAENVDWEDLAQDANYIYIGDFGNNVGVRTDLVIYRIDKIDYNQSDSVAAERIEFSYEDQFDFTNNGNSDWDAEAFFVLNDELIVLTKQWQSNGVSAYSIPITPGTHVATNLETYNINGLITGATYNPISDVLVLVGYSSLLGPFTVRIDAPKSDSIFNATTEKNTFGNGLAQIEAIAYVDADSYFVSSEAFSNTTPAITLASLLFAFDTTDMQVEPPVEPPIEEPEIPDHSLILYREANSNLLQYELTTTSEIYGRAVHDRLGRLIDYTEADAITESSIDLSSYSSAMYFLTFYLDNIVLTKAFTR